MPVMQGLTLRTAAPTSSRSDAFNDSLGFSGATASAVDGDGHA